MDENPGDAKARAHRIARGSCAAIVLIAISVVTTAVLFVPFCTLALLGDESSAYTTVTGPNSTEVNVTASIDIGFFSTKMCVDGECTSDRNSKALCDSEERLERAGALAIIASILSLSTIVSGGLEIAHGDQELFSAWTVGAVVLAVSFEAITVSMVVAAREQLSVLPCDTITAVRARTAEGFSSGWKLEYGYGFILQILGMCLATANGIVYIGRRYCGCICVCPPDYPDPIAIGSGTNQQLFPHNNHAAAAATAYTYGAAATKGVVAAGAEYAPPPTAAGYHSAPQTPGI